MLEVNKSRLQDKARELLASVEGDSKLHFSMRSFLIFLLSVLEEENDSKV